MPYDDLINTIFFYKLLVKKIDAIIRRRCFSKIRADLKSIGTFIVDKRNLDDSGIFDDLTKGAKRKSLSKPIPLAKIEMVVSDRDARKVIEMISKNSGLPNPEQRIFVSEMQEVLDMDTLYSQQDLELTTEKKSEIKQYPKRSRFVPLQKFTLRKLQIIYEENKKTLETDYRIKSFSDFANYCIMKSLPSLDKQLKNPTIIYENNLNAF